ncbi:hypothetical protein Tsubulata_029434 [Turnera subulata]|uniref:Uncharacterized protein n=1 Tax=Turnera subulata TaxID=218843 RepID=A0A9Q0GJY6_9ROSI|nr:hypothetical protein Tsubulata_029434 [Turnera subulata]
MTTDLEVVTRVASKKKEQAQALRILRPQVYLVCPRSCQSELTELSRKEIDQQERSNKKAKRVDEADASSLLLDSDDRLFPEEPRRKTSYRSMLTGNSTKSMMKDALPEDLEGFVSEDSDPEDEVDENPYCPTI